MSFSGDEKKLLILVADDNPSNRMMIKKILENYDFRVICVENGEEVITQMKYMPGFDLLLMDINMPGLNGLETASIIRDSDNRKIKDIPIIAITGNDTEDEIKAIKNSGMNSFISKPASPEKIIKTISETLQKSGIKHDFSFNKEDISRIRCESIENFPEQNEIDIKKALSYLGNDIGILKKLLTKFQSNYKEFMTNFKLLIEDEKKEALLAMVHNLKGTSAQICADRLSEESAKIELSLKGNRLSEEEINDFEAIFKKTMETLRLMSIEEERVMEGDLKSKKELLKDILSALEKRDVAETESYIQKLAASGIDDETRIKLDRISFFAKISDYQQAIKTVKDILAE